MRASRFANALRRDYGVDPTRMEAVGLGPYHPSVGTLDNQTPTDQAHNRRVEVVILLKQAR